MNAHITNDLRRHWLDRLTEKFSEIAHGTKFWQLLAIATAVALLLVLLVLASTYGSNGEATTFYGYPGYPFTP